LLPAQGQHREPSPQQAATLNVVCERGSGRARSVSIAVARFLCVLRAFAADCINAIGPGWSDRGRRFSLNRDSLRKISLSENSQRNSVLALDLK